ncbi:hypothetical protein GCM10017744_102290 [Streptomyces antimycoticus]|uniref:Uncharacterized protein n=1 Tax=Streptomyces antimycoticus TaxID=68175 RepID=A0A4D4KL65_9ACTN|nr:hypothetical protein [Streptomyces antimycoticus]GDY49262.1 hypothetical protein SANT12839_101440 [Streptomyces antimycoticus]
MADQKRPAAGVGIFARLDAEWVTVCADPQIGAAVRDWMADAQIPLFGPEEVLAALQPQPDQADNSMADAVLRTLLVRAAGTGRPATWAARIVVQTMLPAAVRIARGQTRSTGGRSLEDVAHVTVSVLFEVARSGRIHPRPGRPAANVALDTLKRTCRELARERGGDAEYLDAATAEEQLGPDQCAETAALLKDAVSHGLEPAETVAAPIEANVARLELLELLLAALRQGTLTGPDAQAISWHHREIPVPDAVAARVTGTTAGAWRRRRARAVQRLIPAAAELATAA